MGKPQASGSQGSFDQEYSMYQFPRITRSELTKNQVPPTMTQGRVYDMLGRENFYGNESGKVR